jgi:hypothetical protein
MSLVEVSERTEAINPEAGTVYQESLLFSDSALSTAV